jgi:CRP-like cAMP-binding protein
MIGLEALALMQARDAMRSWERPSAADWAKVLATFPLFARVSKRRLRKLAEKARFEEFAAGETIASRAGSADALYVILGGAATTLEPGARALGIGDCFGELALIGGTSHSTTVVATQELHVMRVPRQSVVRLGLAQLGEQDRRIYSSERDLVWDSE